MARGEVFVACPKCNYESNIPVAILRHDKYHCSRCGNHIALSSVNTSFENANSRPSRSRPKKPFNRRKRR
ncbi:MAG: hypothetical protein P8Z37_13310 [Acidobacteriota bacterium]